MTADPGIRSAETDVLHVPSHADERAQQEKPSRVTFVLEPYGKLVKLTLIHDEFAPGSNMLDAIAKGWPAILASLKSLLERHGAGNSPLQPRHRGRA